MSRKQIIIKLLEKYTGKKVILKEENITPNNSFTFQVELNEKIFIYFIEDWIKINKPDLEILGNLYDTEYDITKLSLRFNWRLELVVAETGIAHYYTKIKINSLRFNLLMYEDYEKEKSTNQGKEIEDEGNIFQPRRVDDRFPKRTSFKEDTIIPISIDCNEFTILTDNLVFKQIEKSLFIEDVTIDLKNKEITFN